MAEESPRRPRHRRVARRPEEASREKNPSAAGIERFFSLKGPRRERSRESSLSPKNRQNIPPKSPSSESRRKVSAYPHHRHRRRKKKPAGKKTKKTKNKKNKKRKKLKREEAKRSQKRVGKRLAWTDGDDSIKTIPQ